MTSDPRRQLIAEGVIGMSLVLGAHFVVIEPMQERLNEARLERDQRFVTAGNFDPAAQKAEVAALREAFGRVALAAERSADELVVMDRLNSAARESGLDVSNLEKRALAPLAKIDPSPVTDGSAPGSPPAHARHAFATTVSGPYASITRYLDVIRRDFGLVNIESIVLTPEGNAANPRATASIMTTHWWIDSSQARTPLTTGAAISTAEGTEQ